jgi:hypothetical protein
VKSVLHNGRNIRTIYSRRIFSVKKFPKQMPPTAA